MKKFEMMKGCRALVILCLLAVGVCGLGAQEEQLAPSVDENAASQNAQAAEVPGENVSGESNLVDTFVYLPRGRRDPFWDLLGNAKAGKDSKGREAIPGIAGLLIDEIELEGIIYKAGKYYAAMRGPDSRPYLVTVGESVYDGEVVKIDSHSVIFKKILTIAIGGAKERLIAKRLNPEEEQEK